MATCVYRCPETFLGKRTLRVTNNISQRMPAVPESKPETRVNVRGEIMCSDHPATPVEQAQIIISAARSLVETLPRNLSGTSRINRVSCTANSAPSSTRERATIRHDHTNVGITPANA